MPRNENHVYDEDGNDLLAQKPRRPLGTLFAGLGVLAALAAGGWAFHHYRPQQFGKIFSLPGQNPVLTSHGPWSGPATPTPAHNAMLNALTVRLLQTRPVPDSSIGGYGVPSGAADLEVRFTNRSGHSLAVSASLYFETVCSREPMTKFFSLPFMPALLPRQDSIWNVAHYLAGGAGNPGNLYLAMAPHQTKTGWMEVAYVGSAYAHSCGVNELILTDNTSTIFTGGVTRTFPFPKPGPPMTFAPGS